MKGLLFSLATFSLLSNAYSQCEYDPTLFKHCEHHEPWLGSTGFGTPVIEEGPLTEGVANDLVTEIDHLDDNTTVLISIDWSEPDLVFVNQDGTPKVSAGVSGFVNLDSLLSGNYSTQAIGMQVHENIIYVGISQFLNQNSIVAFDETGELVTGFGQNGRLDLPSNLHPERYEKMKIDTDGNLFFSRVYPGTSSHDTLEVTKYNLETASIDVSFGSQGVSKTLIERSIVSLYFGDLVIGLDGKILVACVGQNIYSVCRINSNGTLDETFNQTGNLIVQHSSLDVRSNPKANLHVTSSGDYIMTGVLFDGDQHSNFNLFGYGINYSGQVNTSYGDNGWSLVPNGDNGFEGKVVSHMLDDDRVIISAMRKTDLGTGPAPMVSDISIALIETDGSLNQDFGPDNGVFHDEVNFRHHGTTYERHDIYCIDIDKTGKLLVGGRGYDCSLGICIDEGFFGRYIFQDSIPVDLGLSEENEISLKLFPIPVLNNLKFEVDGEISKIVIFDVSGKKCLSIVPKVDENSIDVSKLIAGTYNIVFHIGDKRVSSKFLKE